MSFEGKVETDPETGEQVLVFSDEMMEYMEWKVGDELEFDQDEYNNIIITNLTKEDE